MTWGSNRRKYMFNPNLWQQLFGLPIEAGKVMVVFRSFMNELPYIPLTRKNYILFSSMQAHINTGIPKHCTVSDLCRFFSRSTQIWSEVGLPTTFRVPPRQLDNLFHVEFCYYWPAPSEISRKITFS